MLPRTPIVIAVGATLLVALVTKVLARPVAGMGIALPTFVPPVVTAITTRLIVRLLGAPVAGAASVAHIAGTLGTLIGADLLNLPQIFRGSLVDAEAKADGTWVAVGPDGVARPRRYVASIGGAGIFDGIFLTGILAPMLPYSDAGGYAITCE